jgi:hypothetical protein
MKGQKTGGRRPGSLNKKTIAQLALIRAAASTTPLEFLLAIMRSESPLIDMKTRIEAARIAAPYCHPKAGEEKASDPKLVEAQPYGPDNPDPLLSPRTALGRELGEVRSPYRDD